jgi:hypothetical protein
MYATMLAGKRSLYRSNEPFTGTQYTGYAERDRLLLSVVSSEYSCRARRLPPSD